MRTPPHSSLLETFLFRSWWVIVFLLMLFIIYERSDRLRQKEYQQLREQLIALQQEKEEALTHQAHLLRQINSQSDPYWVELVLMKQLGVAPEGQTKVFFSSHPSKVTP